MKDLDSVGLQNAGLSRAAFLKRGAGGVIGFSAMAAVLEACGGGGGGANPATVAKVAAPTHPTGQLRWAIAQKPASLDPARAGDGPSYVINQNVYDGLTRWTQGPARLTGALATKWESNADATEWTFTLREGVTFHDGEALTSEAVAKSFDHYRNGKGSFLGSYAGEYRSIDTKDPNVVVIRYAKPFPDLARNAPLLGIISPQALQGSPDAVSRGLERASAGAGAFRFNSPVSGNGFVMEAFDDYWGRGPLLERIDGRVVPDESARIAALRAGDVDFVFQVAPRQLAQLVRSKRFAESEAVTWLQNRLIFACDRAPFTDARARQAVAYALDRDLLIEKLLFGKGKVAKGLMPSGCYGYSEPELQYGHDPAKAKELWTAAGGADHTITIAYVGTDTQTIIQEAEAVAGQLRSAGLKAKAIPITGAQNGDELHGTSRKYDILVAQFGWINGGPFFYTPGLFADTNSAKYKGKDILDLQVKQNATADGPERLKLLEQLQTTAQEQLFVLPVAEIVNGDAFSSEIHGYETVRDGFMYRFDSTYRAA